MATTRNSSIEALRLLAIFGIVIMHVNGPLLSDHHLLFS
jgi:peptidoglycan/LPS O-acetylase OafA/YrhL